MYDTAIILAGGFGTRLRSVVQDMPKPMATINQYPFLHYQIKYLSKQGISKIIIAVGYKHESITTYFKNSYLDIAINYAIEESPLGTGGAFLSAVNQLKSNKPFFVLNGDTFFPINLSRLDQYGLQTKADIALSLFKSINTTRYMGLELERDGRIISLSCNNSCNLVNGGVYWINPRVMDKINEHFIVNCNYSLEHEIFPVFEKLYGIEFKDEFIDIGIPEDYERSKLLIPQHFLN